ncbi:bromodomain adjacent to zinc finger domain protein 1A isoform X2 [Zophobas morio]|uniref:bromodomain adjacent to zinc finger domain protein 1A isoform X2 n=1 Tax=Zophobas morio TaxID=2755281 RepID=UPI003082F092
MPLLKKKLFEKNPIPENIRDDEEVFYCAITNEIFRDYEDFSERMFLCNSMVWTCSLTGKANLTYAEALESEDNAKNSLKEFPAELKIPILYLATKTKRSGFGEMAEDVFLYAKDRFFIGENIETSFTDLKWKDSHVLQVIAPPSGKLKSPPKNGNVQERRSHPAPSQYKYEIEHLDADDQDISEIMIVDCNQIRRKKGSFSREKCKLFLKQYVEQDERGLFVVKPSVVDGFNLSKVTFEQIFGGPIPEFDASRKFEKVVNGKKVRQESLHKFLTKNSAFAKNGSNADLLEKMRKKEEEFKLMKQQKKEREMEMKQKKKEENIMLAGQLRMWNKPKEDLELVDHQILPKPDPVITRVPDEHVGDMFMVLEFVNDFAKLLSTKDFFPGDLTVDIMERALLEKEVAGPLIDLIQMFLIALFHVQDQEASQYRTETENPSSIKREEDCDNMNVREATRLATIASTWSRKYQGVPLGRLPLYSLTTSEVLRLHLLASGAIINNTGARWRYQQRGGYTSEDDPGLHLKLHSPHILEALKTHNVVELPVGDKLKILSCLINQLLTYADVRDIVEERIEKDKQAKADYKLALVAEKRREQEFLTARYKLKKLLKADPNVKSELEKLEIENSKKRAQNESKLEELRKAAYEKQILMGQDRAFRQYLNLESVPGFFVNFEEENTGICLNNVVEQVPSLVNAGRDETLAYIKQTMQDSNSSDKENSPLKSPKKINGVLNGSREQKTDLYSELLVCSADPTTCFVHSSSVKRDRWCFYHDINTFHQLCGSLNKRGVRESELQQNLKNNNDEIERSIMSTPVPTLNMGLPCKEEDSNCIKKSSKAKYENANLGYPNDMNPTDILHNSLIENILEMEEKLFAGNLGTLSVKDREKWRNCLQNKNYKELDKTLHKNNVEEDSDLVQSDEVAELPDYEYPGQFLSSTSDFVPDIDNNDVHLVMKDEIQEAIQSLSVALAQVGRSVVTKFLKKPLGRMGNARSDKVKSSILDLWEQSLLASTSFSQIFLHYSTLDSCVMWGKSVLLTKCRVCRRRHDSENMLLCDSCNLGHHLYCLKPKLKSVPKGDWFCNKCQKERKPEVPVVVEPAKKRPIFRDEENEEEGSEQETQNNDTANTDIEEVDEEEEQNDSDEMVVAGKVDLCKTCGSGGEVISCEKCSSCYHIECVEPPLRHAPRGSWLCTSCKKSNDRKRHHDSSEDEVISKRSSRRDDGRSDLPLHNSALHAVLAEIMKDYNAWPFLRPVQKTEVPDYYDVITKPMDFGTIKYKLNMGEYQEDAQFMSDALLVFQNCNTYNHKEDDVYKCGVELLKHFQKKCKELGLKLPDELEYDVSHPKKKIRTK